MLSELLGDKSLEKFRMEYEKLTNALKKSHESEKRLMTKCRELNAEIVSNSAKVATALKLSQEDQTTITSLKKVQYSRALPVFPLKNFGRIYVESDMSILRPQFYIGDILQQHSMAV